MGRSPSMPDVIEKEISPTEPVEVDVTPTQAESMGLIKKPTKKERSEKQVLATKALIEKNKAWREKLKAERAAGKPDNMVQGLLAEKATEETAEAPEPKKSTIRFRIRKPQVHPRPNHALKRKRQSESTQGEPAKRRQEAEDSDAGNTTEVTDSGVDTDAVVRELKARVGYVSAPTKKFVSMR